MKNLKSIATVGLFVTLVGCGCQPNQKIQRLQEAADLQEQEVATLQDSLSTVTDSIQLAERIRVEQLQLSEQIQDSVHDYIMESPAAALYVRTYDRQPIEIVNDFFEAQNDDARNILLLYHAVLLIYASDESNQQTIANVREGLHGFNDRKRQAVSNAEEASYWKSRYETSAEQKRQRLELLQNQLTATKEELEAAQNEGFF